MHTGKALNNNNKWGTIGDIKHQKTIHISISLACSHKKIQWNNAQYTNNTGWVGVMYQTQCLLTMVNVTMVTCIAMFIFNTKQHIIPLHPSILADINSSLSFNTHECHKVTVTAHRWTCNANNTCRLNRWCWRTLEYLLHDFMHLVSHK